jgi:hypothetical protein
MLLCSTLLKKSLLHGFGCFSDRVLSKGTLVWVFAPGVDREFDGSIGEGWERLHAYGSNSRPGLFILPGDNAAWINFSSSPSLVEAELIEAEYCLRAARHIYPGDELTVGVESDTDAAWKMQAGGRL